MRMILARVVSLVLPVAMMAACSTPTQPSAIQEPPALGDTAPDFSLSSTDGGSLALTEFRGESPVLLYFSMGPG